MIWSYFKRVRNLKVKKFFTKKGLLTKDSIKDYLDKNNFTYSNNELKEIYDDMSITKTRKKEKNPFDVKQREEIVLPQKKKRIRNRSERKRYVSGSLDNQRWYRRLV